MSRRRSLWFALLCVAIISIVAVLSFPSRRPRRAKPAVKPVASTTGRSVTRTPVRAVVGRPTGTAPEGPQDAPQVSQDSEPGPDAIPDEYILSFYSERDQKEFLRVAKSLGVDVLDALKLGYSVRVRAGREDLRKLLDQGPAAIEFSANYAVRNPKLPLLDPKSPESGYVAFGRDVLKWLGIRDTAGWGSGVGVAVLDTGVGSHPSLRDSSVTRVDLLGGDGAGGSSENNAHGTAVASLIAASSQSVRGIAPGATVLGIRVISGDGDGNLFTAAKGIVMAVDAGVSVINCSFGTRENCFLLRAAVKYAVDRGAVVVASTGNESVLGVSYPAAYPDVVAVSAVDARGEHVYFSNRGAAVDIAAPGLGIEAAWSGEATTLFSGTSAAAPLVSGAIAAVMSGDPDLTAMQAAQIVQKYSNDAEAPGRDDELGTGIMNMRRVEQRDERGIYDVAVGRPYLVPSGESGDIKASVFAQNTGTEPLRRVELLIDVNGGKHSLYFNNVQVGQTVSHDVVVAGEALKLAGEISIDADVAIDGAEDVYPEDNTVSVRVVYTQPDSGQ